MAQVNFLFLRLLVSETQIDRQTYRQNKFVIYIYICIYIYIYRSIKNLSCLSVRPSVCVSLDKSLRNKMLTWVIYAKVELKYF